MDAAARQPEACAFQPQGISLLSEPALRFARQRDPQSPTVTRPEQRPRLRRRTPYTLSSARAWRFSGGTSPAQEKSQTPAGGAAGEATDFRSFSNLLTESARSTPSEIPRCWRGSLRTSRYLKVDSQRQKWRPFWASAGRSARREQVRAGCLGGGRGTVVKPSPCAGETGRW